MSELPSGTVTFLFTDIEGSTRLLKALGPDYDAVLADHERILREAFGESGGRVVDTQGDSFFAVFARAGDAIAAAMVAQRALATHPWPEDTEVRVRMGLHSGEPRASGERYIGFGVHRAARIGSAAHGGQIVLSNATRELVQDELPAGTSLRDLGEFELKDLDRPERLYQVEAEGLQREFAPLKAQKVAGARPFWRRPLAALLAGLAIAVTVGAVLVTRGGGEAPAVVTNSLVKIDAATNEIADVVVVGEDPGQVEAVGDYVFVTGQADGTISRIELASDELTTSGRFDATGSISGDGAGALWAVSTSRDEVTQIGASSFESFDGVPLPTQRELLQAWAEVGGGSLWVSEFGPPGVSRWRVPTLEFVERYPLDDLEYPLQVGFGGGAAWVALSVSNALLRIDGEGGDTTEIEVGNVPRDPAFGFDSVWVAMGKDGTVWRIDPRTERARDIIKVGKGPWGVAIGAGSVWVTNHCDGTVSRIDPETNEVVATIELGLFPQWLALAGGYVWVGVAGTKGAQGVFFEECL